MAPIAMPPAPAGPSLTVASSPSKLPASRVSLPFSARLPSADANDRVPLAATWAFRSIGVLNRPSRRSGRSNVPAKLNILSV